MKLVSDSYSKLPSKVMPLRILESICGVMLRKEEMVFSDKWSTIPGQRRNNYNDRHFYSCDIFSQYGRNSF